MMVGKATPQEDELENSGQDVTGATAFRKNVGIGSSRKMAEGLWEMMKEDVWLVGQED